MDGEPVAGFEKITGHVASHVAQADKPHILQPIPSHQQPSCLMWRIHNSGSNNTWQISCTTCIITSSSRTLRLDLQMHLNGLTLQIILLKKKCRGLPLTSVRLPSRCNFRLLGFVYFFTWIIPSELVEEIWRHIDDPTIRFDRTHICRRNAIDTPGVNLKASKKERRLHKRRSTQFSKSLQAPPNSSKLMSAWIIQYKNSKNFQVVKFLRN